MRVNSVTSDVETCRRIVARASRSFYLSSWLLPEVVRHESWILYAFCRTADDAVDLDEDQAGGQAPARRLARLRTRLSAVYAGCPEDRDVDRAFASLVERHRLPRVLPEALLDGMEEDLGPRQVRDESELEGYAVRVAGVVGLMMSHLMGVRDPNVLARANDLGVAMQYTNIARDVGEDARRRRVYLPATWLAECGLSSDDVLDATARADQAGSAAATVMDPRLALVIERLLRRADLHYFRADIGVAHLPPDCRWAIASAREVYSAIGRDVAAHAHDSISRRARVSGLGKLLLLGRAWRQSTKPARSPDIAAALEAARPLIEAVAG